MPQASDEVRAVWHHEGGDMEAEDYLKRRGINIRCGVIYIPFGFDLTKRDVSAARYLLDEWDYAVEWVEKETSA